MRWWDWLLFWRPPAMLRPCVVNFTHTKEHAIQGVLWSTRGQWLTFKDCTGLTVGQEPQKLDGEIVVHRSQIHFLQVLP